MFEIIENIGYGDLCGYVISYTTTCVIFLLLLEQIYLFTKIKKIK